MAANNSSHKFVLVPSSPAVSTNVRSSPANFFFFFFFFFFAVEGCGVQNSDRKRGNRVLHCSCRTQLSALSLALTCSP